MRERAALVSLAVLSRRCWMYLVVLLVALAFPALARAADVTVEVNKAKLARGESVEITVRARNDEKPSVVLLEPTVGSREIALTRMANGAYRARFDVAAGSPSGLYAIHAWTGRKLKPTAVGKASFRVGNIVADFFIASSLDKKQPAADLDAYLKDFRSIGGNFLIAHNLIVAAGALYPSKIAKNELTPGADVVELVLDRADRLGIPVLLSVGWDVTRQSHYKDRMAEIRAIATEQYELYRHHPSLIGFYSWQEGSGTYYAPFVREFSAHIKSLDRGLMTACAPHIDDPLLASYLSVIEDLDMMIYQSAVMASYRPDNRKEYPLRRVRDFSGLGAGAKRLQNKITLTHVELFAYMEKRLRPDILTASFNDIYGQILSAATVTDTDGIALFAYHSHIFDQSKRFEAGKVGRSAVEKALKLYEEITSDVSADRNPIALYVPYSDFVIERWNNYFLPALDAFRKMGIPVDILPYAPRLDESVYPYYPIHMNEAVLERLLKERTILVLANVSGFQQTDSDLIKAFVERGGIVVAFGPQIPYGRTFERKEIFGGDSQTEKFHTLISPRTRATALGGARFPRTKLPSWQAGSASVVAAYEDGSAAILMNKFGKGTVFTILPDAPFASQHLPQMVRDTINAALTAAGKPRLLEIMGTDVDSDIAVRHEQGSVTAAIANHSTARGRVTFKPIDSAAACSTQVGTGNRQPLPPSRRVNVIRISIPPNDALIIRCRSDSRRKPR